VTDRISIIRHATNLLAKTWKADGSIEPYGDGKFFALETRAVGGLDDLATTLRRLEKDLRACVIRGRYVGDEVAKQRDPEEFKPGKVRKSYDYFDDQPLHALCIDVDKFDPLTCDPIADPQGAIDEFVASMLPDEFLGAGYYWQLSNTFGHPSKLGDGLKAHLWFWLDQPLSSAQVKAYAKEVGLAADTALFQPVQPHYTAAPMVEEGAHCPVQQRNGLVRGLLGDELALRPSEAALAATIESGGGGKRLRELGSSDPVALRLAELGLIKSEAREGFNIVCPFEDEHTGASGETSVQYRLPHTGGHALGQFICLHSHCKDRPRSQWLARIGIDEVADEFENLVDLDDHDPATPKPKGIPEAQHLSTDQANAGRIARKFGKRLMVVAGQWYAWTGARWEQDDGEVYRCGCMLSKIIHVEADEWRAKKGQSAEESEKYQAIADALAKWAMRSEMKASIEAALGLAKKLLAVREDAIDRNPWLLNCRNGTVDLRTGEIKDHDPMDYITKVVPLDYDPAKRSETWEMIVARVTLESEMTTRPLASFLQRWFGYCATGSTREQAFVVHYGNGSNGKSTIIDTVSSVLGDYSGTSAPGLLISGSKERHPTELADLFGRRMVTAHETSEGGHLREDLVKQLTGGDKIKGRFMRADFFEFDPTHKLQMLTNHKPIIKGADGGIWRRVLLVPYMARFADAEEVKAGRAHYVKDTRIAERLKNEAQGVLTWIVAGARAWYADGLRAPDIVMAASRDYQSEQDRVGQFLNECCEFDKEARTALAGGFDDGLYGAYRMWCTDGGVFAVSKQKFTQELERAIPCGKVVEGKEPGTRRKVRWVYGVRLLD
jgi:putative DNA primase/helicase